MKVTIKKDYREARAERYPTTIEFIEALSERELGDPTKWNAYMEKVKAVRQRYPKPKS